MSLMTSPAVAKSSPARRTRRAAAPTLTLTIDGVPFNVHGHDPDDGNGYLAFMLAGPDGVEFPVTSACSCGACGVEHVYPDSPGACPHIVAFRFLGLL